MRIGDVIYDNDTVLIASASFNKEEPCKECFFGATDVDLTMRGRHQ